MSKRIFITAFVFLSVAMIGWSIATPVFQPPDEQEHASRAFSAVRGQVYVKPQDAKDGTGGYVKYPAGWSAAADDYLCVAGKATESASCSEKVTDDKTVVTRGSTAARYNPLYYLVVGTGSLVTGPARSLLVMRILSALLRSTFLAGAT